MKHANDIPVAVVIMTKDEESVIERCLASVANFEQVCVVDSGSEDTTQARALSAGAEVFTFTWDGKYPKKKQWCLDNLPLRHDWVLYLDADEVVSENLATEIRDKVSAAGLQLYAAFDAELDYFFLGRRLRHGHRVRKRILLHRRHCRFPVIDDLAVTNMWEVEGHYQPLVDGEVGLLRHRLQHHDTDGMYHYFARHNRYSDWEAHLAESPESVVVGAARSVRGRRFATVPLKPISVFVYAYILRLGFLDGRPGFHYAVAHSFYYWQIAVKRRELRLTRYS